ncbi:MAG: dodecin family protein [Gammaproteobacteria bacterium]|jgi:flavin-binding protein dodecin
MSTVKVIEIISASDISFEDAIRNGIKKAAKSVDGIRSAWVAEQKVTVENNEIATFRVTMRVSFLLQD